MNDDLSLPAPDEPIVRPKIAAYRRHLLVCTGPRCTADGEAQALFDSLGDKFKAAGLHECVQPDGTWYFNARGENLDRIITEHLRDGRPVAELVFHQGPGYSDKETAEP
jgi:(2Fe-2S) ferredoxin